jgi:hypothetical protein|tara:strand:- start:394 stop:621 length:228 start_codon:yes stop_codon:yes gene_type:complete
MTKHKFAVTNDKRVVYSVPGGVKTFIAMTETGLRPQQVLLSSLNCVGSSFTTCAGRAYQADFGSFIYSRVQQHGV